MSHKYSTYIIRKVMRKNKIIAKFAKNQLKKVDRRKLQNSNVEYPDLVRRKYSDVKEKYKILYTDITYRMSSKFVIATLKRGINVIKKIKDPSGIIIH